MHHRKPHRKSRRGCKQCKAKRMKCDEVHPMCGSCRDYDLECDFSLANGRISASSLPPVKITPLRRSSAHTHGSTPSSKSHPSSRCSTQTPSDEDFSSAVVAVIRHELKDDSLESTSEAYWRSRPISLRSMNIDTPSNRLLELKLLHHFTLKSSETLFRLMGSFKFCQAQSQATCSHWMMDLAVRSPGLMDALLGFSAFNLRHLEPGDKRLSYASHMYMTQAITDHARQLQRGITEENAEIVFAGSFTIAIIAVGSHQYLFTESEEDLPLHWFRPWQGVRAIAADSWDYIHTQEIKNLLQVEKTAYRMTELSMKSHHRFEFLLDDLNRNEIDPDTLYAYENSVSGLSVIYDNPDFDYVFKFAAKVSRRFVELLVQNDPRTLTIVGYFFMLLKTMKQVCWLPQSTGKEFRNLMRLLPEEWKPRMQWAIDEFENGTD